MPNESLTPFGTVVAKLLESGALGPEDAPHPNALGHILEISLTEDGRTHLTAALEVIAERFDAAMTPPIDVAAAEDGAWRRGVLAAADVAAMYNASTDHAFRLDDCIASKLNVRLDPPRANDERKAARDALTEKLAAAEARVAALEEATKNLATCVEQEKAERDAATFRAEKAEAVVGRGLSIAEERNARNLAMSKLERVRAERDAAVARAERAEASALAPKDGGGS